MRLPSLSWYLAGVFLINISTNSILSHAGKALTLGPEKNNKLPKIFGFLSPSSRAKNLYNSGKLQEAIWAANEDDMHGEAEQIKSALKDLLENGTATTIQTKAVTGISGITDSAVLTFRADAKEVKAIFKVDGGTKFVSRTSVAKDHSQLAVYAADANSEAAAFAFDEFLGLDVVPYTIARPMGEAGLGSLQVMVANPISGKDLETARGDPYLDYRSTTKPEKQWSSYVHLALLDFIIGNSDRHSNNWLYLPELKRVVAIDHGLSFRRGEGGCLVEQSLFSVFGSALFSGCREFVKSLALHRVNRERVKNISNTSELYKALRTNLMESLEISYEPIQLSWVKPSVKEKFLRTTDRDLEHILAPYVQDQYLEVVIERFMRIKAAFEANQ